MLEQSMKGLTGCLQFTVESGSDFSDSWLPTLDMSLYIDNNNMILYRFYEKPTTSDVCLQADTALSQNTIVQSLVEDVKRRMLNTSELVGDSVRCKILDKFAQKMLNSGHDMKSVRRNILAGIKGYENKLKRCVRDKKPLNRSAKQSGASRRKKKLTGKSDWFKKNKCQDADLAEQNDTSRASSATPHHRPPTILNNITERGGGGGWGVTINQPNPTPTHLWTTHQTNNKPS